jgi:competence protein ComEC
MIGMLRFIQDSALSPADISNYHEQVVTAGGIISAVPEVKQRDSQALIKYVVDVKDAQVNGNKAVAAGRMFVYIRQLPDETVLRYGDLVAVTGQVFLPHGYNNPGLVDSAAALRRQGITARMSGAVLKRVERGKDSTSWPVLHALWRERISGMMRSVMPEKDAAILQGMLFGGYNGIPAEVVQDFSQTGIVHILSVSGTHIALLSGVMLWLGGKLKLKHFAKVLLAAVVIGFYAAFAGFSPPVIRSLAMGLISLSAGIFGRERDAANALMLSALFMLVMQPGLLYDISFELSLGATAGLVFLYHKTVKFFAFLPEFIAGGVSVTIAAQLGVLPFIAWYFSSFSLSSLAANLFVLPIVDSALVIGLLAVIVSLFVPLAGKLIFVLASLLIGLSVNLIAVLATFPGGSLYLPAVSLWGGVLYYIILAWFYDYLPKKLLSFTEVWRRWPEKLALGCMATLVIVLFYIWYPKPVMVHFIDVGQGDATLITTPHGKAIMIDTGGIMGNAQFDIGQRVVLPYLKHYGILKVDYLFLTHGHQDHAGGAAAIAEAMPVTFIGMPKEEQLSPAIERLKHTKNFRKIVLLQAGLKITVDGVDIDILHTGADKVSRTGNESSVLLKVSYGKNSFLFTGDLTGEEEQLVQGNTKSDVLKVGHHGAKTSTTSQFLNKVRPQYAVISAGYSNKFGHPHKEVLDRLSSSNIESHRTDQEGAIVFKTNGQTIECHSYLK